MSRGDEAAAKINVGLHCIADSKLPSLLRYFILPRLQIEAKFPGSQLNVDAVKIPVHLLLQVNIATTLVQ